MSPHEEIKAWLDPKEKDFDIGYTLFVRFGHNRSLALFLARKRRLSKLIYELEKIHARAVIKESPVMNIKPIVTVVRVAEDKQTGIHTAQAKIENQGRIRVSHDEKIHYKDLPEHLQELYRYNRDKHKIMRAYHEKMKLATTDDERRQHRHSLDYLDDRITANWKTIDEWVKGDRKEEEQKSQDPNAYKAINAARSYLSRNVKSLETLKGVEREKMLDKLKQRIQLLQKNQATIKDKTRVELIKHGLINEDKDTK